METGAGTPDIAIKDVKVLVVEDIALNQLLMKTVLDDFGFEWEIAANGKIAIEKLAHKHFDVVLMDLQMPEMNGFEATEHIRKNLGSGIPIIALTANVTPVDLEKCRAVGMNEYIPKPVDETLLYNKIIAVLKRSAVIKAHSSQEKKTGPVKYTNLKYLVQRTKSNPKLILEMIVAYLKQTPDLIMEMKQSLKNKDWALLQATVHKMIPSFSIMGMSTDFENMARKVQEFARSREHREGIEEMVLQLESVCLSACKELKEEFNRIKKSHL